MTIRWAKAWGAAAVALLACAGPVWAQSAYPATPGASGGVADANLVAYMAPGQSYAPAGQAPAPEAPSAATWARPGERILDANQPPPAWAPPPAEAQSAPRPGDAALSQAPPAAWQSAPQAPAQGQPLAPTLPAQGAQPANPNAPAQGGAPANPNAQAPAAAPQGPDGARGGAYLAEDQPLRLRDYEAPRDAQAAGDGAGGWASQLGGMLLKLVVVLVLAGGVFLMVKRSGLAPNLARLGGRGKHLAVMESVALGPQHALHLVSLGARGVALVATSPQGVASLGTFEGGLGMVPAADFAAAYENAEGEVEPPLRAMDALRSFGRQGGRR